jgi:hypothetical protein
MLNKEISAEPKGRPIRFQEKQAGWILLPKPIG